MKKVLAYLNTLPFKKGVGVVLVVNILSVAAILLIQKRLPPQVPLFYGQPEGNFQLGSSLALVLPNTTALLIILLNTTLAYFVKNIFLKKTLILVGFFVTLFAVITTIKIVLLIGNF